MTEPKTSRHSLGRTIIRCGENVFSVQGAGFETLPNLLERQENGSFVDVSTGELLNSTLEHQLRHALTTAIKRLLPEAVLASRRAVGKTLTEYKAAKSACSAAKKAFDDQVAQHFELLDDIASGQGTLWDGQDAGAA